MKLFSKIVNSNLTHSVLGVFIPGIVQLSYIIFINKSVDEKVFGNFVLFQSYSLVAISIVSQLAAESLVRFINVARYKSTILNEAVSFVLMTSIIAGVVTLSIVFLYTEFNLLQFTLILLSNTIFSLSSLYISYILMVYSKKEYAHAKSIEGISKFAFPILFYLYNDTFLNFCIGYFSGSFFLYLYLLHSIKVPVFRFILKSNNLVEYFKYSYQAIPSSLAIWLITSLDKIIITHFWGVSMMGKYAKIYSIANLIQFIGQIFSVYSNPQVFRHFELSAKNAVKKYFEYIYMLIGILSLICILIFVIPEDFIAYKYLNVTVFDASGVSIFQLLVVTSSLAVLQNSFAVISALRKKLYINTIIYLSVGIVGSVINYYICSFGLFYSALNSIISYLLINLMFIFVTFHYYSKLE